ncbi:hypothetical protein CLV70_1186 [Pseudosporangium ferrugineum]|uniref:CAAX prenyl protease 2/Lysostaphin resistance protein A-like domain-containing protein n=1 Tax=Pseudosporangium ferrugineum TaxID=439699 RepID=A0A2T0RLD1_9ACTN|nr:hypothetical protein CLV70_1186 [Pseudosporangium ferrugineum]
MAVRDTQETSRIGLHRRPWPIGVRLLVLLAFFAVLDVGFAGLNVTAAVTPAGGLAVGVATAATALLLYGKVVGRLERRATPEIALRALVPQTARGVALGIGLFALSILLIFICDGYRASWGSVSDMAATAGLMIGIATCEELLFRGVLFRIVEERAGTLVAAIASSAVFGAVHLVNPEATVWGAFAIAVEMGLLTAGCFALTRRLWLPIGFHLGWNFAQSGIFGATVSGSDGTAGGLLRGVTQGPVLVSGGAFGPEASVFAVLVGGLAGGAMLALARRRGRWRSGLVVHQAAAVGQHDSLHPVAEVELGENARDVRLHGLQRDRQLLGDLGVGEAAGHQPQHLEFAGGQDVERAGTRGHRGPEAVGETADQGFRHGG